MRVWARGRGLIRALITICMRRRVLGLGLGLGREAEGARVRAWVGVRRVAFGLGLDEGRGRK